MLKQVIQTEQNEQQIEWTVLFDGICKEEEYLLWQDGDEPTFWMLQVHAMAQRLGRSVDKFDAMLSDEEYALAWCREQIWQNIRQGGLEAAEMGIVEYGEELAEAARGDEEAGREAMPEGEQALHQQFLLLARAEIARRKKRPYAEQSEIILSGLRQTIPESAWGLPPQAGSPLPQRGWLKKRRFHLMEQFLLARFARVLECMGEDGEAFLWYQELSSYLLANVKDRADLRKLYPLLCYRMAANRLRRMSGEDDWWKDARCQGTDFGFFVRKDGDELQGFRDAQECAQILEKLTDALEMLCLAQKQFPLFRKMERMRLTLLKKMQIFGEHTAEENTFGILERAWGDVQKMVSGRKEGGRVHEALTGKGTGGTSGDIWDYVAATSEGNRENDRNVPLCDNLDPDYMERSMHAFEELLYERMELYGWDVNQLGDGIYADPKKSLVPIFKGKAKPKPKKRKMLKERLGMYWKKYDPGFLTKDDAEYKKYARMMRAYSAGKYEEGRQLLSELEEKMDWKYETNQQFGTYWDALFDWKQGEITGQEKNAEMWKVVGHSGIKKERLAVASGSLLRPEWSALMEVAWDPEGEDLGFLAKALKKQKGYLEEKRNMGFFRDYYIQMLYCLCYIERELGNLDEAGQYADQGLRMMYWLDSYIQWGALLFEKFRIVEDRKQKKGMEYKDFEYIRQAYAVEKMFSRSDMFCGYIREYLSEVYGQDVLADIKLEG